MKGDNGHFKWVYSSFCCREWVP